MFQQENVGYHRFWVRLVCCLAVAIALANAVYFRALSPLEQIVRYLLYQSAGIWFARTGRAGEISIVFAVCVLVAAPRYERPVSMVVAGAAVAFAYLFLAVLLVTTRDFILPVASPIIGILGTTGLLETMAWSEERARRRRLERLAEARVRFTDMLVHDLRKRMSSILSSLSVLEKRTGSGDAQLSELLTTMRASAERTVMLIGNLLDIRRIEERGMVLHYEPVAVPALLDTCIREHTPAADLLGVKLRRTGRDGVDVRLDPSVFSRVLANLIWNALQHAPAGTEIEVGCALAPGGSPELYVANRGEPIPSERRRALFHPFNSAMDIGSIEGVGLGLAFCRLAAQAHGGTIEIVSPWKPEGDGVKVVVRLPASSRVRPRDGV